MKCSPLLFTILTGATLTVTLCIPPGQSNGRETLAIMATKEQQRLAIREASLEVGRTELQREDDAMKRNINSGQQSRQQRPQRRLSPRAENGDDLTPEQLDALPEEEATAAAVHPETPTLEEVMRYLSPEERETFMTARKGTTVYRAARFEAEKALLQGRELTSQQQESLQYGRQQQSVYHKLRRLGIKKLAESGTARPEVVAYWNGLLETAKASYAKMTEAERKAYNKSKAEYNRRLNAAKQARLQELEALDGSGQLTEEQLQELAELRARNERIKARNKKGAKDAQSRLSPEQREAQMARYNARRRQERADNKAARKALEARIRDGTATAEDRQEWAQVQKEEEQAKTARAEKKVRMQELEEKVRNKTATPEEQEEWEEFDAKRERNKAAGIRFRERRKQKGKSDGEINKSQATNLADQSGASASTEHRRHRKGTIDPSNSQPLQVSDNLGMPSVLGDRLHGAQKANVASPGTAGGESSAQLRNFFPAMKDGFVDAMQKMGSRLINELGKPINQAKTHPSTGPFLSGGQTSPSVEILTPGKVPVL